jgi:hypothetical protein
VVLRLGAETLAWNGLLSAVRNRGTYAPFHWHIHSEGKHGTLDVHMDAMQRMP